MTVRYETLYAVKEKKSILGFLLVSDFEPEESDRIIIDLARKIEQYEQGRGMETEYERVMSDNERIVRVRMKSRDGVIQGVITYEPPIHNYRMSEENAKIKAEFDFNSGDGSCEDEYFGLAKILNCTW